MDTVFKTAKSLPLNSLQKFIRSRTTFFRDLGENALEKISEKLKPGICKAGSRIIEQGEIGDCLYIVVSGVFNVVVTGNDQKTKVVAKIRSGDCMGEGALITKEPRNATIVAETDGELLMLTHSDFQDILQQYPGEFEIFVRIIGKRSRSINPRQFRPSPEKMRDFLSGVELLKALKPELLKELEPKMQWLFLPGGETLMTQGEAGDSMYIVVNGRFRYFVRDESSEIIAEGEFSKGDVIGEMALLTGENRSATVYSVRGSELLCLPLSVFEQFITKNPEAMLNITKTIAKRLRMKGGKENNRRLTRIVTLLPLDSSVSFQVFSEKLMAELSLKNKVCLANKDAFIKHLSALKNVRENAVTYDLTDIFSWLYPLEEDYDIILFCGDPEDQLWTETALQHTDKIFLLGNQNCHSDLYPVEIKFLSRESSETSPARELILLYDDPELLPADTGLKLERRKVERYHHVRLYHDADFARIARSLLGRSIGVALAGGGAKGFAHIGVLKAFEEENIPIDLIGGTSAGAIMASLYALGHNIDTIEEITELLMVKQKLLNDYTYPFLSLVRGKKYTQTLRKVLGEKKIEDLWIPFFSVATNLTEAQKKVSDKGALWKAVRSSTSLPGILPPLYDEEALLVDGGLLDNIPSSVLKEKDAGFCVAINIGTKDKKEADRIYSEAYENSQPGVAISSLKVLNSKINPFAKKSHIHGIGSILMRSTMVSSIATEKETIKNVDLYIDLPVDNYSIFDWKKFREIIETGYNFARQNLSQWKEVLNIT